MTLYLGENLKALRQMRGLTQEDLAFMIGVTAQSVSKWERGETYPDITLLPVLAACFDVSTDALLGTDREKREREVQRYVDLYDNMALQDLHAVFLAYEQAVKDYPADARILVRYMELLLEEIADALEIVEFVGVMMIDEGVCLTVAFGALREAVEAVVFVDITYLLLCILLYGLVGLR